MLDAWVDVSWEGTGEAEGGEGMGLGMGICRRASENIDEPCSR